MGRAPIAALRPADAVVDELLDDLPTHARGHRAQFPQLIANYTNQFPDGRQAKSTSIGIKDSSGRFVAALCMNVDLTVFSGLQSVLNQFGSVGESARVKETLDSSGADAIRKRINEFAARRATTPRSLKAEDRRALMRELTDAGLAVARRASLSDAINGRGGGSTALRYWRGDCSDLDRARTTARIVLGLDDIGRRGMGGGGDDDDDDGVDGDDLRLVADPRLREIAKGAREGYLKRYTVEEALVMRRREASASSFDGSASSSCALLSDIDLDIPKLEGEDDAWDRARDWIDSIIDDAFDEYRSRERRDQVEKGVVVVASSTGDVDDDDDDHPKVYDVFALSHSALIRTMIRRMVGSQLPSVYARTREGSLDVPNL
ncbi:PAS domain-containing protein, partial [bacterium]|nr:PAS domain-containing protein [bacterium]